VILNKDRIRGRYLRPLLVLLLVHLLGYQLPKLVAAGFPHYNLELDIDRSVPVMSWMIIFYIGAFVFWIFSSLAAAGAEDARAQRFFAADLLSKLIAAFIFIVFPTTNSRPELGTGFWDTMLGFIYLVDTPVNLFPSVHCMFSWTCFRSAAGDSRFPGWYRALSLIITFLIFFSTVALRQHVLADVLGGWVLSEICWQLCGAAAVRELYCRLLRMEAAE